MYGRPPAAICTGEHGSELPDRLAVMWRTRPNDVPARGDDLQRHRAVPHFHGRLAIVLRDLHKRRGHPIVSSQMQITPAMCKSLPPAALVTGHLGWIRLGYGEMTEEFRAPSDHLESLHCSANQY